MSFLRSLAGFTTLDQKRDACIHTQIYINNLKKKAEEELVGTYIKAGYKNIT
jgi:hypothetical protein